MRHVVLHHHLVSKGTSRVGAGTSRGFGNVSDGSHAVGNFCDTSSHGYLQNWDQEGGGGWKIFVRIFFVPPPPSGGWPRKKTSTPCGDSFRKEYFYFCFELPELACHSGGGGGGCQARALGADPPPFGNWLQSARPSAPKAL